MTFIHEMSARILEDSLSPTGSRITTMEVTFPRNILAEVNTHRKASKNSASSRAIPLETMLQRAIDHPFIPEVWPREQPGMSGGTDLEGADLIDAQRVLADLREATTSILSAYIEAHPDKSTRLHKSYLNRPLEWFMWHTAIITSTEWENLFKQRISKSAQPEFHALAVLMREALYTSTPKPLAYGEWHLPLILDDEREELDLLTLIKVSTARCARVSYLTHSGVRDIEADLRLYEETLLKYGHWSPLEHVAVPLVYNRSMHIGNSDFPWVQFRALVEFYGGGTLDAVDSVLRSGYHPSVSGYTLSPITKDAS